jgi:hypothetical protein
MERLWSQLGARRRELPCHGATHKDPLIPPQLGDNVGLGHSILHRQIRGKFRGNRVAPERRPFERREAAGDDIRHDHLGKRHRRVANRDVKRAVRVPHRDLSSVESSALEGKAESPIDEDQTLAFIADDIPWIRYREILSLSIVPIMPFISCSGDRTT